MYDFLLGLGGQSSEQAARRDMVDYDPSTGTLKRSGMEKFGDLLRGGPDAVNAAARELHVKQLKNSAEAKAIRRLKGNPDVTSSTTEDELYSRARELKLADSRTQRQANYDSDPATQALLKKQSDALIYQKGRDREGDRRFESNRLDALDARRSTTALGMAQLDITRQQEANRMSEETRRYNERRSDSKKERMAAIIAGLANLGGAFTI